MLISNTKTGVDDMKNEDLDIKEEFLDYGTSRAYLAAKRLIDIIISVAVMIVSLPVFVVLAAIVKVSSRGPVFTALNVCGLKGRQIKLYRFRTKIAGCFIERSGLSGLPQLLKVIKGEMSIVGPRPAPYDDMKKMEAWYSLRLSVKPGITGLWYISGWGISGFDDMVRLDLKYIRERNFRYDIKIILKTVPAIIRRI